MRFKPFFIVILIACCMACGKDDFQVTNVSGTIVDSSGIQGLENCGYMVRIDGELYKPTYLNRQYEQDGLSVLMKVEFLTEKSDCSTLSNPPSKLRIEQIRLAN